MIKKSPWVSFYNAGGCNGCTIEALACTAPKYDIERLGVLIKESAKQCDVLVIEGIVNKKSKQRINSIYKEMNEPKVVVALGTCATTGGTFRKSYNFAGPLDKVLPVDVYIPGCPPRPEAIIDGLRKVLECKKLKSNL